MSKSITDMELILKLTNKSKTTLNVQSTEEDPYKGYLVRNGDYHIFRDKSIVNRYQDVQKKTNFYHKLHLAINITTSEDYKKLWHLVTNFVQDYQEVSSTKIISLDVRPDRVQKGKEAVIYFAPDFWEGYKSQYQMLQRQKEIMEDINRRLLAAGLSCSAPPEGDIPVNPANEQSLVYISPPEYTINVDGSYGEYIYAKNRESGFFNPYDEKNLVKLRALDPIFGKESHSFSFFSLTPSPKTQFGIGIAMLGLATAATITLAVLVSLDVVTLGLALPITILAIGIAGAIVANTALFRDEPALAM